MMFEFKDGDVCKKNNSIFIFKSYSGEHYNVHVGIDGFGKISEDGNSWGIYEENNPIMLASKEEKEKLFKKMELEGLRWNNKTKKVESFERFKVGDTVRNINTGRVEKIMNICGDWYMFSEFNCYFDASTGFKSSEKRNWEIYDPNNKEHLVPFETKILVRHSHHHNWQPALFGYMLNEDSVVIVGGLCYPEFIPYLGNEDKLGKVTN